MSGCDFTCSWFCREHLASRLWMTLVRSKQSIQLLRNVPDCSDITFPSDPSIKYLQNQCLGIRSKLVTSSQTAVIPITHIRHSTHNLQTFGLCISNYKKNIQWRRVGMTEMNMYTQTHLACRPQYRPKSGGDAISSYCILCESQKLCTSKEMQESQQSKCAKKKQHLNFVSVCVKWDSQVLDHSIFHAVDHFGEGLFKG